MKNFYEVEINYLYYWDEQIEKNVLFPKIFKLNISCEPEELDLAVSDAIVNYLDDGIDTFEFDYKIIKQIS
jgi:hypothetical protein